MKVYISNGTMQHRIFQYRCPRLGQIKQVTIPAGRQAVLDDTSYTREHLRALESQLVIAGGVLKSEAGHIARPFSLLYWIDEAISSDAIDQARERDVVARQEVAAEVTEQAGLATFATLAAPQPDKVREATLDVVQLDDQGGDNRRGVNFEATVSTSAGKRRDGRRRAA